jgi:hypothetical protein
MTLLTFILSTIIMFMPYFNGGGAISKEQDLRKIEIVLVKALDMRCYYNYSYETKRLSVKCENETNEECSRDCLNINEFEIERYIDSLKQLDVKVLEFNDNFEGEFLRVDEIIGTNRNHLITMNGFDGDSECDLEKGGETFKKLYALVNDCRCF